MERTAIRAKDIFCGIPWALLSAALTRYSTNNREISSNVLSFSDRATSSLFLSLFKVAVSTFLMQLHRRYPDRKASSTASHRRGRKMENIQESNSRRLRPPLKIFKAFFHLWGGETRNALLHSCTRISNGTYRMGNPFGTLIHALFLRRFSPRARIFRQKRIQAEEEESRCAAVRPRNDLNDLIPLAGVSERNFDLRK